MNNRPNVARATKQFERMKPREIADGWRRLLHQTVTVRGLRKTAMLMADSIQELWEALDIAKRELEKERAEKGR